MADKPRLVLTGQVMKSWGCYSGGLYSFGGSWNPKGGMVEFFVWRIGERTHVLRVQSRTEDKAQE